MSQILKKCIHSISSKNGIDLCPYCLKEEIEEFVNVLRESKRVFRQINGYIKRTGICAFTMNDPIYGKIQKILNVLEKNESKPIR